MAYGGPTSGPTAGTTPAMKQVKLEKESELRIEVNVNSSLRLRLLNGTAEIFGTEMPPENWLIFPPRMKFAIFTWYGATIEMQDNTETDYVADETPMISYVNVHAVLEGRRNRAKASASDADASQGPRVIVVGPTDSGKSTLARMLLSWAAKQGWKPTFVDLDIGQGSITLPGCIAATPIEMPIDPVEGIPLEMPLVYFYGHNTPTVNADLYRVLVKELAQILERQFAGNAESRAAGMVINTMGFIDGLGYDLLLHAIDTFQATVVLVMGQDKLCSMLKDVLKQKPNVDVVKLQKSGGVVSRNSKFRAIARNQRIREYFYGLSNDLSPHSSIANFSDLAIYRIGGGPQAPASALPIGAQPVADPMRLVPVNINRDLLNLVLAVSFAKDPDQILSSPPQFQVFSASSSNRDRGESLIDSSDGDLQQLPEPESEPEPELESESESESAGGIEVEIEKVSKNRRRIRSKVAIDASLQTVWGILTDYERLAEIIPSLVVSQVLDKRINFARLLQQHSWLYLDH